MKSEPIQSYAKQCLAVLVVGVGCGMRLFIYYFFFYFILFIYFFLLLLFSPLDWTRLKLRLKYFYKVCKSVVSLHSQSVNK